MTRSKSLAATLSQTVSVIFFIIFMASQTKSQLQPMNITRTAGETYVFIPCPFETSSTRSIWRINGTDYTASTLPSIYSLTPGGLFIIIVHICLNQVPFQCIDISSNSLQEEVSQVGVLTVVSPTGENCTDDALREYLMSGIDASGFELDHRRMQYGSINTTLAWKITPPGSECNISWILSYPECQQNSPDIDVTTDDTTFTVPSTSLFISRQLVDFNLSSLSEQESVQCAGLDDTVRINVNQTEIVNVLLGNNNCSCARLDSLRDLYFAISNPDPDELDITCPIHVSDNSCYNPERCRGFKNGDIVSFFRICENRSENSFSLCSSSVTEQVNDLRLDFFTLTRAPCTTLYYSRTYIRSFEFRAARASSNIEINLTSREICFSSSTNCSLASSTQYSVLITDLSGNIIFERDEIPESTCLSVDQLGLLPRCGPFMVSTRPVNDYIMYNSELQQISSDTMSDNDQEPALSRCLEASVQLQLDAVYNSQDLLIEVNLQCSTIYVTPIYITLIDENGFVNRTTRMCSNERFEIMLDSGCNHDNRLCGYITNENGSLVVDSPLNCSNSVQVTCPTVPPTRPGPSPFPIGGIIGIVTVLGVALVIVVTIILIVVMRRHKSMKKMTIQDNGSDGAESNGAKGVIPASNGNDHAAKPKESSKEENRSKPI